jgi:hypothetical protein
MKLKQNALRKTKMKKKVRKDFTQNEGRTWEQTVKDKLMEDRDRW